LSPSSAERLRIWPRARVSGATAGPDEVARVDRVRLGNGLDRSLRCVFRVGLALPPAVRLADAQSLAGDRRLDSIWTARIAVHAALGALSFDFFFIPPLFALERSDLKSFVTLIVMIVVAAVISGLAERARRQQRRAQARDLQIETERLRSSLLSAVSHDLRTPLATIFGAGTELLEDGAALDAAARDGLVQAIVEEAAHLDQMVTNLLEVARLDGGAIEIRKRLEPLDEVVEAALSRLRGRLAERAVRSRVPEEIRWCPSTRC